MKLYILKGKNHNIQDIYNEKIKKHILRYFTEFFPNGVSLDYDNSCHNHIFTFKELKELFENSKEIELEDFKTIQKYSNNEHTFDIINMLNDYIYYELQRRKRSKELDNFELILDEFNNYLI